MDIYYTLGIIGAFFVLIAFFISNSEGKRKFLWDEVLNFTGSMFLTMYAWRGEMWPFFVLNLIWTLWSVRIFVREFIASRIPR